MIRGIYLSICLFRFVVKNLKTKKISYWHRKNDVFNPIISDHCWWCGQEHLTVHAQNPKKNLFFLTVLKMSILSLDKLGLGKLLLNCMYIFFAIYFHF